ncbi:MAG: serine/threonine protein kinase [Myxococcaceae bacterium]|nr:serine/threonine protein kinase [Myxococcaceae bacterium]
MTEGPLAPESVSPRGGFPGAMLGKYRIVEEIGIGGMAQVFLAVLDGPDGFMKPVVVKRILSEFSDDETYLQMFVNEAKVSALMSHPNVVTVHEFTRADDENFILVMEYVNGASLDRVVRAARKVNYPLGYRFAVELGVNIAHALSYAHQLRAPDGSALNLVHRDVSPGNVLISRDGLVKLSDFGVVKSSAVSSGTAAGVVKGKWAYMSPEQVSNRPIDHRSDLFSLGIILYEVATQTRLFRGDSLATTVGAVMHAEIVPPSQVRPEIPVAFDRVVMKALARLPGQRWRSAGELAQALDELRAEQGWTQGAKALSNTINALFPRDSLKALRGPPPLPPPLPPPPVATPAPVPPAAEPEVLPTTDAGAEAHDVPLADEPGEPAAAVAPEPEVSPLFIAALLAVVLLASASFWFFVL